MTLVWNPDDLALAVRSLCEPGIPAKYIEMPKARYAFFQVDKVLRNGSTAGLSLDLGYLANEHAFVSLATVDAAASEPGTEVTVLWGERPNSAKPAVEPPPAGRHQGDGRPGPVRPGSQGLVPRALACHAWAANGNHEPVLLTGSC